MLCITVARNAIVNSYINMEGHDPIKESDSMKMLGFTFGRRPNADHHIETLRKKFYGKLWILQHLA